jgi:hypothetical protein
MWVFLIAVVAIVGNFVSSLKDFKISFLPHCSTEYIVPMGQVQSAFPII